ncbi:DUF1279 super [Lodderomyces elongisporus]|uniref:DUF1279 domain-containing protein n=1 Tax=Lodderomyces elongisporus (strain ATCC 11503 / CBS 2605 / JCM 1781 / NBRC 1676 / NRRL YB-4239) TaxID=379508 RepID=A5DUZ4_LODEL|nr:DUF1279 super [Lodderomyces elongisporus]EDK43002.1 conserved hypothetical protein [Lodderomyces elongisporus NRRL YB-4239]WLF77431.1 DUF1279 super [Lodderomyces elongisporus]
MYTFNPLRRLGFQLGLNSSYKPFTFRSLRSHLLRRRFQSTTTTTPNGTHPPPKKPQGIKALMKEYGYPALGVYLALSFVDLPICYVLVHSMGKEKIEYYENKVKQQFGYGLSDEELQRKQEIEEIHERIEEGKDPNARANKQKEKENMQSMVGYLKSQFSWTEFLIAYGLHKSLIFIRLPITAAITPSVVKLLRSWGFRIGQDKLRTSAKLAKDLAKSGINDFTASNPKFGSRPGKRKWWWFF